MRRAFEREPLADGNEPIRREFTAFGTKSGSLPGVLTEAAYAVPRDAAAGGVAALFLDEVSR